MSIVFFLDHDEWHSPKNDERARNFISIRKKVVNTMAIWSTSKMFSQLKLVNIPLYLRLVNAKKPPSLKTHPQQRLFKPTAVELPGVYRWDGTFVLCTWWQGRDDHQWGWSPVLTKSLGCRLVQLRLEVLQVWNSETSRNKVEVRHINFEVEVMSV